jgi:hypothetical protein
MVVHGAWMCFNWWRPQLEGRSSSQVGFGLSASSHLLSLFWLCSLRWRATKERHSHDGWCGCAIVVVFWRVCCLMVALFWQLVNVLELVHFLDMAGIASSTPVMTCMVSVHLWRPYSVGGLLLVVSSNLMPGGCPPLSSSRFKDSSPCFSVGWRYMEHGCVAKGVSFCLEGGCHLWCGLWLACFSPPLVIFPLCSITENGFGSA